METHLCELVGVAAILAGPTRQRGTGGGVAMDAGTVRGQACMRADDDEEEKINLMEQGAGDKAIVLRPKVQESATHRDCDN